jgi:hypothetical protein
MQRDHRHSYLVRSFVRGELQILSEYILNLNSRSSTLNVVYVFIRDYNIRITINNGISEFR